jgi:hypothetical protein
MPELGISAEKVAFVALKAREFGAKIAPFDEGDTETSDEQDRADGVLENRADDPSLLELREAIEALDEDERTSLVALAWLGRGTYDLDEWDEARRTARGEASTPAARYLIGMPMLADYLEEGLAAFGISVSETENDVVAGRNV